MLKCRITYKTAAARSGVLDAMYRRVGLCLQAEGKHFLYPCPHLQGMQSPSFVFVRILMRDLSLLTLGLLWVNHSSVWDWPHAALCVIDKLAKGYWQNCFMNRRLKRKLNKPNADKAAWPCHHSQVSVKAARHRITFETESVLAVYFSLIWF